MPKHWSAAFVTTEGQVTMRGGHSIDDLEARGSLVKPQAQDGPHYKDCAITKREDRHPSAGAK